MQWNIFVEYLAEVTTSEARLFLYAETFIEIGFYLPAVHFFRVFEAGTFFVYGGL